MEEDIKTKRHKKWLVTSKLLYVVAILYFASTVLTYFSLNELTIDLTYQLAKGLLLLAAGYLVTRKKISILVVVTIVYSLIFAHDIYLATQQIITIGIISIIYKIVVLGDLLEVLRYELWYQKANPNKE